MTDLSERRRSDIASCPRIKQSNLGKCRNENLRTLTLVTDRTLRTTADFASALSNVFVSCGIVVFLSLFSHKNHLRRSLRLPESCKIMKTSMGEILF